MSPKLKIGYVFGSAFFLCAIIFAWTASTDTLSRSINVLVCLLGGVSGWITGLLLTPTPPEKQAFHRIGSALIAFVSGFLMAKLEPLFQASASKGSDIRSILFSLLLFGVSFGVGALFVFVGRKYWRDG